MAEDKKLGLKLVKKFKFTVDDFQFGIGASKPVNTGVVKSINEQFGPYGNYFNLTKTGWHKVYKTFGIDDSFKDDKARVYFENYVTKHHLEAYKNDRAKLQELYFIVKEQYLFEQLVPHLKKITGTKVLPLSEAMGLNETKRDRFATPLVKIILEILGVIKEESETLYTDTGQLYENTIRNSLNDKYKIAKWRTYGLPTTANNEEYVGRFVGEQFITENKPEYHHAPLGNIFNLPLIVNIQYHGQVFPLYLGIFGGMPDGFPVFLNTKKGDSKYFLKTFLKQNAPWMVEVKTKCLWKVEQIKEQQPECDDYTIYTPNMVTQFKSFKLSKKNGHLFATQIPEHETDKKANIIKVKARFPVPKIDRAGNVYYDEQTAKAMHLDDPANFNVHNDSYYCQASTYIFLAYLQDFMTNWKEQKTIAWKTKHPNEPVPEFEFNETIMITDELLSKMQIIYAMGFLNLNEYYWSKADYKVVEADGTERNLTKAEQQAIFRVDQVYTQLYNPSMLKLRAPLSKYSKNDTQHNGEIDFIGLLAQCSDTYVDFFKHHKGILLDELSAKFAKQFAQLLMHETNEDMIVQETMDAFDATDPKITFIPKTKGRKKKTKDIEL